MGNETLKITCDLCDARKIKEENYAKYDRIILCADTIVTDERSKSVMEKLPFDMTVDETVQLNNDSPVSLKTVNGTYDIKGNTTVPENTWLSINGAVKVTPDAKEALKQFMHITINGIMLCPESLAGSLPPISTNGSMITYPDDYTVLDFNFSLDKYFPMRAAQSGKYFAPHAIFDLDKDTDFKALGDKNVKFKTKTVYLLENHINDAMPLFNIDADMHIVPEGYSIINDDVVLNDQIIKKYGTKLYILKNLTVNEDSEDVLSKIEKLEVEGCVYSYKNYVEDFKKIDATYKKLIVQNDNVIRDLAHMTIDRAFIDSAIEKTEIRDCALVNITDDVTPDEIIEKLQFADCALINCSESQKGAVSRVSTDVALIRAKNDNPVKSFGKMLSRFVGSDADDDEEFHILGAPIVKNITADKYDL